MFAGEVSGLIGAGAFVAFSADAAGARAQARPARANRDEANGDEANAVTTQAAAPPFEGMLPVRRIGRDSGPREWWELNEQGTVLHGEHTGATLRLGDPIEVRVDRIDAIRGRVDLAPAP